MNAIGWGPYSQLNVVGSTIENVPSIMSPPIVVQSSITNTQAEITWSALTGANTGGSNVVITSYDIQYSLDSTNWINLASGLTTTSYTQTGLSGGTNLYYRVRAENKYGPAASYSGASIMITTSQAPATPTPPTVLQDGTYLTITWTQPFDNYAPITGYAILI